MGINSSFFPVLKEALSATGKGDLLMYGVQDLNFGAAEVADFFNSCSPHEVDIAFDSYAFFKMLGFSNIFSLDISESDSPSFVANMNDAVSDSLYDQFDFIYDGGTLEHVFNVAQALENGVKMLRNGGMVFHHLPMNNCVNHGFYQFSPGLFFDYYGQNSFINCNAYFHGPNNDVLRFGPRDIIPDRLLKEQSMVTFVAEKTSKSTTNHPIQFMYAQDTEGLFEEIGGQPFFIWGASGGFANTYQGWLEEHLNEMNFLGFIDSDESKQQDGFCGFSVNAPSILMKEQREPIILIASTHYVEIEQQILEMGLKFRLMK